MKNGKRFLYLATEYRRIVSVDVDDLLWRMHEVGRRVDVQVIPRTILKIKDDD